MRSKWPCNRCRCSSFGVESISGGSSLAWFLFVPGRSPRQPPRVEATHLQIVAHSLQTFTRECAPGAASAADRRYLLHRRHTRHAAAMGPGTAGRRRYPRAASSDPRHAANAADPISVSMNQADNDGGYTFSTVNREGHEFHSCREGVIEKGRLQPLKFAFTAGGLKICFSRTSVPSVSSVLEDLP